MPATTLAAPPEKSRHAASQAPYRAIGCADQAGSDRCACGGLLVLVEVTSDDNGRTYVMECHRCKCRVVTETTAHAD